MDYKKYRFPIQIFLIFEKILPAVWGSKISRANCSYCFLPSNTLYILSCFLKNDLILGASYLVDASCIDTQAISRVSTKDQKALLFFIFYFLFLKKRIIFCFNQTSTVTSIDSVYSSANWLEREFGEMFGIFFSSKVDARNLLLDYSLNENPLIKAYPSVGLREVHYSILSESVIYSSSSQVEL